MDGSASDAAGVAVVDPKATARALRGTDTEGSVAAWQRVLDDAPHDREAHKALAGLLSDLNRPLEAARHVKALIDRSPDNPDWWRALARFLDRAGDAHGAIKAWQRLASIDRLNQEEIYRFSRRLQFQEDVEGLRTLVEREPNSSVAWGSYAQVLADIGAMDDALVAWRRAALLGPSVATHDGIDKITHLQRRRAVSLKIVVLGNCQAYGIAQGLRALLRGAEVSAYAMAEYMEDDSSAWLIPRIADADIVVAHPITKKLHPVQMNVVRSLSKRIVIVPRIAFNGFHPDLIRIPEVRWTGNPLFHTYHSSIIAGAYLNGLPEAQVPQLFNSYMYSRLGYFDEYRKSVAYMNAIEADIVLRGLEEIWLSEGIFVHIPVHPHIRVLHSVAEGVCKYLGLDYAPTPPGIDPQSLNMIWPVYPEIAKRIGVPGSMVFRPGRSLGAMGLEQVIDHYYSIYRTSSSDTLNVPSVAAVRDVIAKDFGF